MSIVRFKHHPTNNLRHLNNHFFNADISQFMGRENVHTNPKVNIYKDENGFKIELAAPGLGKEDFKLNLEKNTLKISTKREIENESTTGKYTRREFSFANFERSFTLPETVNKEHISAAYENGILSVNLPHLPEVNRKMEIEVA